MAKQIKGTDIIEDGHLSNAIKQTQELLELYKKLDETILKTAKDTKRVTQKTDTNKASGIQKLNKEVSKSNELKKASIQIDNQIVKAESKLISLDKQRAEQLAKVKLETQRANKEAKEQAILTSKTSTEYEKASVKLNKMRKRLKDLALTEDKASKKTKLLAREVTKLDQKLKKADAAAGQFQRNVGNYKSALGGAVGAMKRFAGALGIVAGVQLLVRGLKDAFNVVKNFDQAQANLASVLGISRDAMGALTKQAKELGATTKFTASQVAELQLEYAKLGFTMEQIEGMTEATLQLAAAAGTELGNAASIVGATMRGFGLDVTETQRVVDLMANSFSKSSLDIEKFKTGMAAVAPAASTAGFSIERTTALLGTLTNSGIDASTAGTGLRNIFLELTNKGLTFEEAMAKITNATDQNAAALSLFGKRGATLGVILANNQTGVDDLTTALENSGGAAKEMADKQLDTLGGSLDILRSAWEGVILEMNEGTGAGEGLKEMIKDLAEALPIIVKALSEIVSVIATQVGGLFKLVSAWSTALESTENFKKAIILTTKRIIKMMFPLAKMADALHWVAEKLGIADDLTRIWKKTLDFLNLTEFAEKIGLVSKETKELTDIQKKNNATRDKSIEIGKELLKQNEDELGDIPILIDALNDENTTREEKQEIMDKLKADYPEYIGNIDLETASTEQLIQVKKDLIKQLFEQAIAQKKAEVQAEITGQILEKELQKIGKSKSGVEFLNKEIEDLTKGLLLVDDVEAKLRENLGKTIDTLNLESPIGKTSAAITELKNEIEGLEKSLKTAEGEEAKNIEKRLKEKKEKLRRFEQDRIAILNDGLDKEKALTGEDKTTSGGVDEASKKEDEERKRRLKIMKEARDRQIKEIEEAHNKRIKLMKDARERQMKEEEEARKKRIAEMKAARDRQIKEAKEAEERRKESLKKMRDESLAIFKEITEGLIKNIDKRIEARRGEIDDANNNISRLQDLAAEGNTDAAEAIKAERIRVANEKLEIEQLEKRKRNLLIVVTALEKANQNLGQGDGNAFKNASASMKEFLAGLPTFSEGTAGTVAQALGKTGTKDGHVVRVDDREHILSIKDSERLHRAGLTSNDAIVGAAMAAQNNALSKRILRPSVMTDQNIVSELKDVKKAIKGIEITQQHIDLLGLKEVIKKGNKTIKNDYNPKWKI